ncbi:hypothetical protein BKI52_06795 [marine bacterium AO1-C]|nr:hypothetical protein BKI52_06795 [marine bacterium AO1-C]
MASIINLNNLKNMKRLSLLTIALLLAMFSTQAQVLPDLFITSLNASAVYEAPKSSITMSIGIRVAGASVGTYRPAVYVSDRPGAIGDFLGYLYVGSQNANTTHYIKRAFTYNGNATGKYLVVRVDGQNQITESNENNNIASAAITEVKPDLRVSSIDPSYTYDGTRSTINLDAYIYLANKSVGAYSPAVYISDRPNTFGNFLGYLNVSSHTANTTKKVSNGYPFRFNGDAAGKYIVIRVDGQNQIDESNENNNVSSQQLPEVKPDLFTTSITASYNYTGGRSYLSVRVNVYVANVAVGSYNPAVYISDRPGAIGDFLGYMPASPQSANTTQTLTKSFIYNGNASGKYIVIRVDGQNQIDESNENNNVTSGSIVFLPNFRTTETNIMFTEKPVYPNPATNYIKLNLTNDSPVAIYDLQGRMVASKLGKMGVYSVDISSLKPGTYWVKTAAGTQQFIKK